jgi:mono/diheme cytochrome c family protein
MCGMVRHTLAITAVLCLGSFAAEPAGGQRPQADFDAAKGRDLYIKYCSSCHGENGEGRAGMYPPLKGSGMVIKADPTKQIQAVLHGLQGGRAGGVLYPYPMPAFGSVLNDVDIAGIIDHERSSWGNRGKLVIAAQVAAERDQSK